MTLWVRNSGKFNWMIFLLHVASTQESAGGGLIWRVHGFTPPLTCLEPGGLGWNCMFMRPPSMEVPGQSTPYMVLRAPRGSVLRDLGGSCKTSYVFTPGVLERHSCSILLVERVTKARPAPRLEAQDAASQWER